MRLLEARGAALNVKRLPRGVAAAPSSRHLDANESGTKLAKPLRLPPVGCAVIVALVKMTSLLEVQKKKHILMKC